MWRIIASMSKSTAILLILLSLILLGAGYYLYTDLQQQADSALQPFAQANSSLQTEVADLMHPTPTIIPDPATYIEEVRALARLETIQYTIEKVITAEIGQGTFGFLFGDRLLFVGHGIVIAGIDLSKMNPQDMQLQGNALYVRLPEPEIFVATLDNQKSYVYDRQTGALTRGDINLEATARQAAEDEIKKAAIDDGILEQARANAESFMKEFFGTLGYDQVVIVR
jgi:hypothetical protein